MKFEYTEVYGFEHAIRGMRNAKNSHHKADSCFGIDCNEENVIARIPDGNKFEITSRDGDYFTFASIGENDMELAQKLIRAGSEHRKFMRQIQVYVDITAPIYWWKEFDTYKVGTVANSTSTMHKLADTPIEFDCFELDDYDASLQLIDPINIGIRVDCFLEDLEQLRQKYLITGEEQYWKELIRWLPEGWLQTRTVSMNYENLLAMCSKGQRRFHKLNEWSGKYNPELNNFIKWARKLPYAQEFIFIDEENEE